MIRTSLVLVSALAMMIGTAQFMHAAERARIAYEWTPAEQKRITSNALRVPKADDGYFEHKFKNLSARTNVSAELAVSGFYYLETVVETFGKVTGLAFSKTTYGSLRLVIHDKADDFKKANPEATGSCTHKVMTADGGKTDIEFHVVVGNTRSGTDFGAVVPLAHLQYEIGLAFAQLCTGKTTTPPFLARGLAEFCAGWDMRVDGFTATTVTAALYGTKDQVLRLMLKDPAFMPTVASLVALTPADFTGANQEKNAALALALVDFMIGPYGKRRSTVAKLCTGLEKDGAAHDYALTLLEEKGLKKLHQEWRLHLCRIAGRSLMPEQFAFEVEGSLPRQVGLTQGGNYGHRPAVVLTPMVNGAYTLAWHDSTAQTIRLLACDAQNQKTVSLAPEVTKDARSLLGCAYTGKNNTYVIAYSKDHAVGGKDFAYHLCGIKADGTKIFDHMVFGDKPPTEGRIEG
jgi:hypothetical protein